MGKTVAIVVLTVTAVLLAGAVVTGLRENSAQAQAGRYADYVMTTVALSESTEALVVLDSTTQRMLYFFYDSGAKQFVPIAEAKADLKADFAGKPTGP
jgi:hypothetical protein